MKYIINLTITFDAENRRLSIYNDARIFIELTKPATRLLLELITNNKINVSRDDLLNNVWINYGYAASNAGLNNYISELRKSFATLEMNREVIITIPKIGFRMHADIQTIAATDSKVSSEREEDPEKEENAQAEQTNRSPERILPNKAVMSLKIKAALTLLPLLLIVALVISLKPSNQAQHVFLYQDAQCKVSTIGPDKGAENIIIRAKNQIAELGIDCQRTKHDIFYIEQRPGENARNRVFIVACNTLNDNEYSSCTNFKYTHVDIK